MTKLLTSELKKIAEKRNFTSFWEAFNYFKLASYTEIEALQFAAELFNGDIWGNVISATKENAIQNLNIRYEVNGISFVAGLDPASSNFDELNVEIYILTDKANPVYKAIYKAYVETKKYAPIEALDTHIKMIKINLTSEIAIELFNNGYNNI